MILDSHFTPLQVLDGMRRQRAAIVLWGLCANSQGDDLVAAPKSSRRPRLERRRLRGAAVTSPSSCEARRRFLVTGSTPLYAATLMYVNYSERYSRTAFAPSLSSQHREIRTKTRRVFPRERELGPRGFGRLDAVDARNDD